MKNARHLNPAAISRVVPYSSQWPRLYSLTADELRNALGLNLTEIEHVGSTAVPGLCSKPVIDVAIGVQSLEEIPKKIISLGYTYVPGYESALPFRRFFHRYDPVPWKQGVHLHVVKTGHPFMMSDVAFRDHLLAGPVDRERYACLKESLSGQTAEVYYDGKAPLIEEIKRRLGLPLF